MADTPSDDDTPKKPQRGGYVELADGTLIPRSKASSIPPHWTDENLIKVVEWSQAGKSQAEIAKELGEPFTKSAVGSKLRRLRHVSGMAELLSDVTFDNKLPWERMPKLGKDAIPTPKEYIAACEKLGKSLEHLSKKWGFGDPAEFGKLVAAIQDPPRLGKRIEGDDHETHEPLPYSAEIVKDWWSGKLSPNESAWESIYFIAGDESEDFQNTLGDLYITRNFSTRNEQYAYSHALLDALAWSKDTFNKRVKNDARETLDGVKIPSAGFIEALNEVLKAEGWPKEAAKQVCDTYTRFAKLHQSPSKSGLKGRISPYTAAQHTELSQSLHHTGLTGVRVAELLNRKSSAYLMNGSQPLTFDQVKIIENAAPRELEVPLTVLFDLQLREIADGMWQRGVAERNLGLMMKACRLRTGICNTNAFGALLPEGKGAGLSTVHDWENGKSLPMGSNISTLEGTVIPDYIALMQVWENNSTTPGGAAKEKGVAPWFDEAKAHALSQCAVGAFESRMDSSTSNKWISTALADQQIARGVEKARARLAFKGDTVSTEVGAAFPVSRIPSRRDIEGQHRFAPGVRMGGG